MNARERGKSWCYPCVACPPTLPRCVNFARSLNFTEIRESSLSGELLRSSVFWGLSSRRRLYKFSLKFEPQSSFDKIHIAKFYSMKVLDFADCPEVLVLVSIMVIVLMCPLSRLLTFKIIFALIYKLKSPIRGRNLENFEVATSDQRRNCTKPTLTKFFCQAIHFLKDQDN